MDDLLTEFLTETSESLGLLDSQLVELEQNPEDPALLGSIFRIVHTIKGTCGFLGLSRLEKVAHAGENVLGRIRDGALAVSPEVVSIVLEAIDRIKAIVAALAETAAEPAGDDSQVIARLGQLLEDKSETAEIPAFEDIEIGAPATNADKPAEDGHAAAKGAAMASGAGAPNPAASGHERDLGNQAIRVNVELLEDLMTTVSELVLTRNQLMQTLRAQKDSAFAAPLHRLSQVTTELQEGVMKTRMQPIGTAWGKLPRLVRDLARELGKKLDLRMIGAETELDRQVLEMVKDPLTHMVRNCADHGIETPAERVSVGKAETGTITLHAYHVGGHIVVEIADDGKGLDIARIRKKVVENGLASESELAAMTEQQVQQFIFKAGFSTAAQVTSVSGRGVGMDVVRTNIEKIGGTVELQSEAGKGSRFIIKIPLTLAIVSALIVECAGERFAFPQINVVELVRASQTGEHRIERLHDAPVLRLRERILPLVSLQAMLGLKGEDHGTAETFVIVTQIGAQRFGIIVDRVFDTEEIVVKPVAPMLRDIAIYSGNTILGDGSVIIILDPNGIAAAANLSAEEAETKEKSAARDAANKSQETVLLFRAGGTEPKAVPLALVARLEAIDRSDIERTNGRLVVQYRGKLMPLVGFDEGVDVSGPGRQPVLVFVEGQRSMGLMVDEIVDIVEEGYTVELRGDRSGLIGSAVIAGKATDIVDVGHYLARIGEDWFAAESDEDYGEAQNRKRILLVDDSAFFRNMLQPLLAVAGYEVTTAESAEAAMRLCEAGETYDVIISDIEMPQLDGLGLAEKIRESQSWKDTPLIAVTSHATARDRERTAKFGFDRHVAKSEHTVLVRAISETIAARRGLAA
jgi:two-component system, chemotaxis family, sensor kinase CheA